MTTKRKEVKKTQEKENYSQDQCPVLNTLAQQRMKCQDPDTKKSPQEVLEEEQEKYEDQVQGFMGDQSGLFSSVGRSLIFGIIGTIWVITYVDGKLNIPNKWLLYSLIISLFYLLADVCHYFSDTISYQKESKKILTYNTIPELKIKLREGLTKVNRRSVTFVIIKFVILFVTAIVFGVGLFFKIKLNH